MTATGFPLCTSRVWSSRRSLRELHFGSWEGLKFEDLEKKWPKLAKRWAIDPMKVAIPRGEPFSSLQLRVKRFLVAIRHRLSTENILVVAHGGTNAAITLNLLGLPAKEFPKQIQSLGSIRKIDGARMTAC